MLPFELFFERCQSPVEVLRKYKDDPDVFISFTAEIEPRGKQEGVSLNPRVYPTANKKTTRVGLNPLTHYDTPVGVYTYPLKVMWDDIKQYDIPYVKDMPHVYVLKTRNPERCARTSTYTGEDFKRDSEELMEIYPQYHLEDIINTLNVDELVQKYPDSPKGLVDRIYIGESYRDPPLRMFWSITRSLAYLILNDIQKHNETKTKHITIWTHIMRQFYDGIIDDTGSSTIHSNEPTQAVFWTNAQFKVIDRIDRFCGKNKEDKTTSHWEWTGENKINNFFQNRNIFGVVKKAYSNDSENQLPEGMRNYLSKSGVHNVLTKMKRGDSYPLTVGFENVFDNAGVMYQGLAIDLYLDNLVSDEMVFDDNNLSDIPDSILRPRIPEIIFLLKKYNSFKSAKRLFAVFSQSEYKKELEPLYVKLLNSLFENVGYSTLDVIERMLQLPFSKLVKTPRVMSMLTKAFFAASPYYGSSTDEIASNLINLISMTGTKNPVIWRRFFPYFTNNRTSYDDQKAKSLNKFLESKTGLDEELKEYTKTNTADNKRLKDLYNDVWFKYYGVDLFTPTLSQLDAIKKSKTTGNTKYKVGDVVTGMSSGELTKFIIKGVDADNNEYTYDIYKDHGQGWFQTLTNYTYPIDKFETPDKKKQVLAKKVQKTPKVEKDALGDHGFDGPTHEYSVGDQIIVKYKNNNYLTKFIITGVTENHYEYECYNDKNSDGDYDEGFTTSFGIKEFDEEMKAYDAVKINKTPVSHKYYAEDTFISDEGTIKTVVKSFDENNETYAIVYYAKDSHNGQWNEYLKDNVVGVEGFEKDVEKSIQDGSMYHDIKI